MKRREFLHKSPTLIAGTAAVREAPEIITTAWSTALKKLSPAGCGKKTFQRFRQMLAFRTLHKRGLLSLTSLPPGETGVREQAAEIPFFRSLLVLVLFRNSRNIIRDSVLGGSYGQVSAYWTA